jgi:eukaryotic-like serine/threonine-protein kinase
MIRPMKAASQPSKAPARSCRVWSTLKTKSMLGGSLLGQKKYAEAEPLLKEGYEGMKQRAKTIPAADLPRLTEALERLVQFHDATGNATEADRWRKELAALKADEKKPTLPPLVKDKMPTS